jgi:hypothetical protein
MRIIIISVDFAASLPFSFITGWSCSLQTYLSVCVVVAAVVVFVVVLPGFMMWVGWSR